MDRAVVIAHGFSNFTAVALDGTKQDASALGTTAAAAGTTNSTSALSSSVEAVSATVAAVIASSSASICGGTTFVTVTRAVSFSLLVVYWTKLIHSGYIFCCSSRSYSCCVFKRSRGHIDRISISQHRQGRYLHWRWLDSRLCCSRRWLRSGHKRELLTPRPRNPH